MAHVYLAVTYVIGIISFIATDLRKVIIIIVRLNDDKTYDVAVPIKFPTTYIDCP